MSSQAKAHVSAAILVLAVACGGAGPATEPVPDARGPSCDALLENDIGGETTTMFYRAVLRVSDVKAWHERNGRTSVAQPLQGLDDEELVEVCGFTGEFSGVPSPGPGREWADPTAAYFILVDGTDLAWMDTAGSREELPPPPVPAP